MKTIAIAILLLALAAAGMAQDRRVTPIPSGRRLALLVGNAAYPSSQLQNSVRDAQSLAAVLRQSGFETVVSLDTGLQTLDRAISAFAAGVHPGDVALFYYSGHGLQVDGENYLVPVDFRAGQEAAVPYQAYSAARVLEKLQGRGAGLSILILDACRDNPFRVTRSGARGLASMSTGKGSFIAFATAPGGTASDNPTESNGLFTKHLLETLSEPGLKLGDVFDRVRERVYSASAGKQLPWTASSVIGTFVFRDPAEERARLERELQELQRQVADAARRKADQEQAEKERDAALLRNRLKIEPPKDDTETERARLDELRRKRDEQKTKLQSLTGGAITPEQAQPEGDSATHGRFPLITPQVNPKEDLKYVWIPAGKFMMGCSPGDLECGTNELLAHEVVIKRGFWLGQTPVHSVTWDEAQSYCRSIGGRLPAEAEWEYAARGGTSGARYGSVDGIAWYDGNSGQKPHGVAEKQPNAYGLYDMLGNVAQWTADFYSRYNVHSQGGPARVQRGGSWEDFSQGIRVSTRFPVLPGGTGGFRCTLDQPPSPSRSPW